MRTLAARLDKASSNTCYGSEPSHFIQANDYWQAFSTILLLNSSPSQNLKRPFWLLPPGPAGGEAGSQKPGARMRDGNRRTGNSSFWLLLPGVNVRHWILENIRC